MEHQVIWFLGGDSEDEMDVRRLLACTDKKQTGVLIQF